MPIASVTTKGGNVFVANTDGDEFTYATIGPDWKDLALVTVQIADRSKEPEARAAAIAEVLKAGGTLKP